MEISPYLRRGARRPALRVVSNRRPSTLLAPALVRPIPLEARPYRPGELPQQLSIRCDERLAADCARAAAGSGLPLPLWIRVAVEASRVRDQLADGLHQPPGEVLATLDEACSGPLPTHVGAGEVVLYAREIIRRRPGRPPTNAPDGLQTLVPDGVRTAWILAATEAGLPLDAWIGLQLGDPPQAAADWEAASVASGLSIGEWAYNCWAAASATSAAAQMSD